MTEEGLADAVVTPDGDALCFGARSVIKTLGLTNERNVELEAYDMGEVEGKLGLTRRDLVAAMLLLGSDFDAGVKLIGPVKTRELLYTLNMLPSRSQGSDGGGDAGGGDAGGDALGIIQKWIEGRDDGISWVKDPRLMGV